jgi:hypothetical protein
MVFLTTTTSRYVFRELKNRLKGDCVTLEGDFSTQIKKRRDNYGIQAFVEAVDIFQSQCVMRT